MQIVIEIDEEDYKGICRLKNEQLRMLPEEVAETLIRIANGTPLPKNHGRLIDLDALCDEHLSGCYIELEEHEISEIPVIIEGTEGKE